MTKNWLKVFRIREVVPGLTPILIASLDTGIRLDLSRLLLMTFGFLCIFFSSFLINELIDSYDTDQFNTEREKGITRHGVSKTFTLGAFILTSILGIVALWYLNLTFAALGGFLLLLAYSVPPFRIKSRPILDLFAVTTGFVLLPYFSFLITAGKLIDWHDLLVLCFFASGFFAIDLVAEGADLDSDQKAGLKTSAVFFGEKKNLIVIQGLAILSTILGAAAMLVTGRWWYLYLICMTFFLFTAMQFGQTICNNRSRLHELLRTGERFGIFVSDLGTAITLIIFITYYALAH